MIKCLVILVLSATPALSAACTPDMKGLLGGLSAKYGEVPRIAATVTGGEKFLMTVNKKTGTWTVIFVSPEGLSCLMTSGNGYTELAPNKIGNEL